MRLGVPGAITRRLRRQMNFVGFRYRIGPRLQTEPGIVEVSNRQSLQLRGFTGSGPQAAIVYLSFGTQRTAIHFGEDHAAPALVRKPAEYDTIAALRVGDREPGVTAGILFRRQEAARAERLQLGRRFAESDGCGEDFEL